jgi:hypothetical protein
MDSLGFLGLFGVTWNTAFELTPSDTDNPGEGDDRLREGKSETRKRADQEHEWLGTASTGETVHKAGSARAYYQTSAPTLRPDGITALGANDDGRIWVDSDNNDAWVWDGSAFTGLGMNSIVDQGGGTHLKEKIIEIGDWNMDTTASVSVAHGLTLSTIRAVDVIIRPDDDVNRLGIYYATAGVSNGDFTVDATNVTLSRTAGGSFDSANYNATSFNRGYIVILYVEV